MAATDRLIRMPSAKMKCMTLSVATAVLLIAAFVVQLSNRSSATTIHLVGDSTMAAQLLSKRPGTGWGEAFATLTCEGIQVVNHARNGRSSKSFLAEGRWSRLLRELEKGDVVIIQFGHNDQKSSSAALHTRAWGGFTENLEKFVLDVKAHQGQAVLMTPIVRRAFNAIGKLEKTHGEYPSATRSIAKKMDVALLDLNLDTYRLVNELGPQASRDLYLHLPQGINDNYPEGIEDDTHLNSHGAMQVAKLVADSIVTIIPGLICL